MDGKERGNEIYPCEGEIRNNMRRSLATKHELTEGDVIEEDDIMALRPSGGLSPMRLDDIVGARTTRHLQKQEILEESDFQRH
jgi:sialic acid synthase SpsE